MPVERVLLRLVLMVHLILAIELKVIKVTVMKIEIQIQAAIPTRAA